MIELAIYDMDRTVTRTGTLTGFLIHAALACAPWRLLLAPAIPVAMLGYALRIITRARLKEIAQALLLGRTIDPERLRPVAAAYAERTLRLNVRPGALRQIADDRRAGRWLVLATASSRIYVEAIAARAGFDDVIATNALIGADGRIVARIDGENCYGPAKLRMIEAWMAAQGIARAAAHVRFYSDHRSDAPVLAWADAPFAVNPDPRLRTLATRLRWPIVDWG